MLAYISDRGHLQFHTLSLLTWEEQTDVCYTSEEESCEHDAVLYRHGSDYIEVTDTMGRYSRHTEYPMNILIVMAIR